jgi:hypothetical protein
MHKGKQSDLSKLLKNCKELHKAMIIYKLVLHRAGGSLNMVPRCKEPPFPNLKQITFAKLLQKKPNKQIFKHCDEYHIGVVPLRTVLIILLHYIFQLLPINGHDMNRTVEINFHLI